MAHTSGGNAGGYLRAFAKRVRRSCRRMAQKLNCIPPPDAAFAPGEQSSGPSRATSSSRQTPVHHGAAGSTPTPSRTTSRSQTARSTASGSRSGRAARGKAPATPSPSASEHSGGHNSEDSDPTYGGPQEVGMSQMFDAPPLTQGESSQAAAATPPRPPRRRRRDHTEVGSVNLLPTEPGRQRRPRVPHTSAP
ncbi:unnamed protein product [Urochloa humidicola]